jgi:S-sulfo-L-cysteine synthase (O-acetyl-L-serine-dependent)
MTVLDYQVSKTTFIQPSYLEKLVGNTPLLPLQKISKNLSASVQLFAKAEWFNPGGSIKDRPALNIIRSAIASGELSAGKRLLDSTSGNTGIAYATFGAALGIPVTLTVPANASPERIIILQAMGVELFLTDPLEGSDGALRTARQLAAQYPDLYFYANQYNNPANWQAHYYSTGPEIIEQTNGRITHFVAGMGTSGTLMGTGRALREFNPNIHLTAVQPDAPFHGLEGLKHMPSAIVPQIYNPIFPDSIFEVKTEEAYAMTRRLAKEEGLLVGISSGAAAYAALKIAEKLQRGMVVTIFPDAGYKYLSDINLWREL